jgi:hypothetical protein
MQFDWSTLGSRAPTALVKARTLAHHAAQWPTKAARANLEALPDDSHSSLEWDGAHGALFSQPLPAGGADVRVGLRLGGLALILKRGNLVLDTYELAGRRDSMVGVWLDSALRALGLKAATGVTLPYTIPSHPVARGSAYAFSGEMEAFDELVSWFDAATDMLDEVRGGCADGQAGAVLCWPHHFDIAMLINFEASSDGAARSIGAGLSPGDHYYHQPYVYVSPWPHLKAAGLPLLPPPGHWHTHEFVGAVATAEQILALDERRAGTLEFVRAAYAIGREKLGVAASESASESATEPESTTEPAAEPAGNPQDVEAGNG